MPVSKSVLAGNVGLPRTILLLIIQLTLLLPVFLEEYIIFIAILACLVSVVAVFYRRENALIAIAFAIFFPIQVPGLGDFPLSELIVLLAVFYLLLTSLVAYEKLQFDFPGFYPILLMLAAAMLSMVNAKYPVSSIKQILKQIEAFLIVYLLVVNSLKTRKQFDQMLIAIVVGAACAATIGMWRYYIGLDSRAFGLHGGLFGAYVGVGLIVAFSFILGKSATLFRLISFSLVPVLTGGLLIGQTRAWIVGTMLGIAFIFFTLAKAKQRIMLITLLAIISVGILLFTSGTTGSREANVIVGGAVKHGFDTGFGEETTRRLSFFMRLLYWTVGFKLFLSHPVFGLGIGNLRFKAQTLTGELTTPGEGSGYVDNHWLNILYETGIVGFLAWMWLVASIVRTGRRILKASVDSHARYIPVSIQASLLALATGGIFWTLTVVHEMTVLVGLLVAMFFASRSLFESKEGKTAV